MNQEIFREIQALKRQKLPDEKVILFGSQARGDARADSKRAGGGLPILISFLLLFASCSNPQNTPPPPVTLNSQLIESSGNAQLDSLLQLAAFAPQDTVLARLYYEIGDMYDDNDYEKAKAYYQKLGNLSEQLDWNEGRYLFAAGFALILTREGLMDSSLVISQKAYELAVRENNESWAANMNLNMGAAYMMKGWHETALIYYMKALPFLERENNAQKLQTLYYMMSQLYTDINAVEKAIEYAEKSVALNREDPYAILALGGAYSSKRQYEKAQGCFEEALLLCGLQNNIYLTGIIYFRLADDAMSVFDLDRAEKYAHQMLEINGQLECANCCENYLLLGKIEMLKGNYGKSEEYLSKALEMAVETGSLEGQRYCYTILSELAAGQRRYRENVQYWDKRDSVEKEIAAETALRASEEMAAKYETEKKDFEIERQQHVIRSQNIQRWLLAGGIAVCAVFLVLLLYMLRLRLRRNLALTERNEALTERTTALDERNEALSEMNATKDKFFSIISHDMRNPVVAQRDALQMLVKNSNSWDANTLTAYYRELLNSADGQVELIYNLLGWAQLQTGRITYNPSTFNLAHRLRSDINLIRNMAEKKGVSFAVSIPDDADITGDASMLSVVVRNLLTNAVKFTEASPDPSRRGEEGMVRLDVTPIYSDMSEIITGYTVTISDTGVGMNAEQIGKLFRLDSARSRKGTAGEQGSGLGLIVCRELLEKHGSELHVESEEGKGSRFWFEV